MSRRDIHRALSSEARIETLNLLYKKPHDIEEIAHKLQLQPVTVRHHIQTLLEAGLLESYEERSGSAGRPKTFYKIAKELPLVTFPARRYLDFSKSLVNTLVETLGKAKTKEILAKVGNELGIEVIKSLEATHKISKWTPKEFVDVLLNGYFREAGAEPEVLEVTDSKVVYQVHNCLLSELSKELPELLCDALHHEFQRAILDNMKNGVKGIQTSCMGHGDSSCQHIIEWTDRKK